MRKLIILVLAIVILTVLTGCHRWHSSTSIGFGVGHGLGYSYEGYGYYQDGHHVGHRNHHGNHH